MPGGGREVCRPGGGQPISGARHLAPPHQLVMHPYHVATFRVLFNPRHKLSQCLFNTPDVFGRPRRPLRRVADVVGVVVVVVVVGAGEGGGGGGGGGGVQE